MNPPNTDYRDDRCNQEPRYNDRRGNMYDNRHAPRYGYNQNPENYGRYNNYDRRCDNRGWDNRGYGNQRYDNQGYGNRGYGNQYRNDSRSDRYGPSPCHNNQRFRSPPNSNPRFTPPPEMTPIDYNLPKETGYDPRVDINRHFNVNSADDLLKYQKFIDETYRAPTYKSRPDKTHDSRLAFLEQREFDQLITDKGRSWGEIDDNACMPVPEALEQIYLEAIRTKDQNKFPKVRSRCKADDEYNVCQDIRSYLFKYWCSTPIAWKNRCVDMDRKPYYELIAKHAIDYLDHPAFKRNTCRVIYVWPGVRTTIKELIDNPKRPVRRLYQTFDGGNRNRVSGWIWVNYAPSDPVEWHTTSRGKDVNCITWWREACTPERTLSFDEFVPIWRERYMQHQRKQRSQPTQRYVKDFRYTPKKDHPRNNMKDQPKNDQNDY